jgi:hypothetical protein
VPHLVDFVQVKWAKLRGTPGSAPEKLVEAEREVNEAETRLRDTKVAYEVRALWSRLGRGGHRVVTHSPLLMLGALHLCVISLSLCTVALL